MTAPSHTNMEFLVSTLESEWREAVALLDRWDDLDAIEQREFVAEWPLLADWWDRVAPCRRSGALESSQAERVETVRKLIQDHLPQLERIVGPNDPTLDNL